MLRLAAEYADIIGFTGSSPDREGRFADGFADFKAFEERVEFVRAALGKRGDEVEFNVLV